ncbi:hypothetical protein DFH06DRAFT_1482078 [Mycena polygramma]|nr:hypothetical protein DFH06DRAFT_1482078 [Mycena polygramma]
MEDLCWISGARPLGSASDHAVPSLESADFARLLSSNDPPLESHIPAIRDIISDGQNQIEAVNARILRLHAALAKLNRERDEIAQHLRNCGAILSPVRRMPPELICAIFALTLAKDHKDDDFPAPPWYLGHICRFWRDCALGYPHLWSSITIPSSPFSAGRVLPILETQLLRSTNAPLDVYWPDVESSIDFRLLELILPQSNRWRTLCIYADRPNSERVLDWLQPVKGNLGRLEKLELVNGRRTTIPDIFSVAPRLRKVIVTDTELSGRSIFITVPWEQITHYRGAYSAERHLEILDAAPNLLECSLAFDVDYAFDPHAPPPITLPLLRRLYVEEPGFLVNVMTPSLEELTTLHRPSTVLALIRRSSCTLKKLALQCPMNSEIIPVLQGLPSLTDLLLENRVELEGGIVIGNQRARGHIEVFTAMFVSGSSTDLCPSLSTFSYGYEDLGFRAIACAWQIRLLILTARPRPSFARLELAGGRGFPALTSTVPND